MALEVGLLVDPKFIAKALSSWVVRIETEGSLGLYRWGWVFRTLSSKNKELKIMLSLLIGRLSNIVEQLPHDGFPFKYYRYFHFTTKETEASEG